MAQRDPHEVLGVDRDASQATVKAAWRRLAREHHPDLAADAVARRDATRRMAEINAAYQALRSGSAGRAAPRGDAAASAGGQGHGAAAGDAARPSGPPPPPPTRPVTARFDTTHLFRPRNATTTPAGGGYRHRPRPAGAFRRATWGQAEEPRASDPTGPLQRVRARRGPHRALPSLGAARATEIAFGKFHGHTLGEIEVAEPSYLEWLERTITRDPDLVAAARVILDQRARRWSVDDGGPDGHADELDAADGRSAADRADAADGRSAGDRADAADDVATSPGASGSADAATAPGENEDGDAGRRPREAVTRGSTG